MKKKAPPIGFGRTPTPKQDDELDDELDEAPDPPEGESDSDLPTLPPPLATPVFVGEMERYELFSRYDIRPLLPLSAFEMQLVQIIAGLEKRIQELDPIR
jgi:hypothetical protein